MAGIQHEDIDHTGLTGVGVGDATAHIADATDAHDASAISFTPAGTIAATDVQAAIEEVASEASGAGLGSWQTYTPAWGSDGSAPAIGDGTLSGRYRLLDASSMQINITFVRGSTSTNGTGSYNFTLPSGYKAVNARQVVSARLLDSGAKHMAGVAMADANGVAFVVFITDNTNATANQIFASTYPITLATGDELNLNGIIEYGTV